MIGLGSYFAFLGVSLLVICTPGQDTALTIRNTLAGGRRSGVATAAGVAAGQATWTVATSAGLAVLLTASAPLFFAIRIAGAAYLVYLGINTLLRTFLPIHGEVASSSPFMGRWLFPIPAGDPAPKAWGSPEGGGWGRRRGWAGGAGGAFLQGMLSNLSNAKMVAFFVSLLPPFAGPHPSFLLLLALGLNFCLLTLAWLTGYAFAIVRMSSWLRRSRVRKAIEAMLGAALVGLGLRVGSEALASS